MMTDPLADMLTRIRNANRIERPAVDMPATNLKRNVAQVLKDEGFILDFQVGYTVKDEQGHKTFQAATDPAAIERLARLGVDGIVTDDPGTAREVLATLNPL